MTKQFTLGKNERLKSRRLIEQLFSKGKKLTLSPFRVHYFVSESKTVSMRFGTGVSNKNFKKAVDRNRIKRLVREAYRLQKLSLEQIIKEQGKTLDVFFIYTGNEIPDYKMVFDAIGKSLNKICNIIDPVK